MLYRDLPRACISRVWHAPRYAPSIRDIADSLRKLESCLMRRHMSCNLFPKDDGVLTDVHRLFYQRLRYTTFACLPPRSPLPLSLFSTTACHDALPYSYIF